MATSTVSLRVFGDDLEPDEVSALLGCQPDSSYRKGDPLSRSRPEVKRKYGMWSLTSAKAESEAFDAQIEQLLSKVTPDLDVWVKLCEQYQVDLFCGFFMDTTNQGFCLSVQSLYALALRGISPGFDIYAPTPEEQAEYYASQGGSDA